MKLKSTGKVIEASSGKKKKIWDGITEPAFLFYPWILLFFLLVVFLHFRKGKSFDMSVGQKSAYHRHGELAEKIPSSTEYDILQSIKDRSEEHTSELQSQTLISYAVFCLDRKSVV